jgi:autotransporter-associated beta strand protein
MPLDGYDLSPVLSGTSTSDPHQALLWRSFSGWAVSKGDWKLVASGNPRVPNPLYNLASDPQEVSDLSRQHPEIATDLTHDLTFWEAQMAKPRWGDGTENQFDGFVFQGVPGFTFNWSTARAWHQAGGTTPVTLQSVDSYANTTLEFPTLDNGNYVAANDMMRMSGQTFMLNQLRLSGNFQGDVDRSGMIGGNDLLFVKSLDGRLPQIRLDATATGTSAKFAYQLNTNLQLLNNLEITGDGTQSFTLSGNISDYLEPCDVTKSGMSEVALTGKNTFKGTLHIDGGKLSIVGSGAVISGAAAIEIAAQGTLTLDGGLIDVPLVDNSAGGEFHFMGGSLEADQIIGDVIDDGASLTTTQVAGSLDINAGTLSGGLSISQKKIHGHFRQTNGTLKVVLGGPTTSDSDRYTIDGPATLGGTLSIRSLKGFVPTAGENFQLLTAGGGVQGAFQNVLFPTPTGVTWHLIYGPNDVTLAIDTSAIAALTGDFNGDGVVNAADYTVWRDTLGSTTLLVADANHNGVVDAGDLDIWKAHFGEHAGNGAGAAARVPEPATIGLAWIAVSGVFLFRRRLEVERGGCQFI